VSANNFCELFVIIFVILDYHPHDEATGCSRQMKLQDISCGYIIRMYPPDMSSACIRQMQQLDVSI
jgi:hypothetical protein